MMGRIKRITKRIFKSKANIIAVTITSTFIIASLAATYLLPKAVDKYVNNDNTNLAVDNCQNDLQDKDNKDKEEVKKAIDKNLEAKKIDKRKTETNSFCNYETNNSSSLDIATDVNEDEYIANGYIPIRSVDELRKAALNKDGNYILMTDLDLDDYDWQPWDFDGKFEGNGHVIYNLKVSKTSSARYTCYDGNYKSYETAPAGFFGILKGEVKNLGLVAAKINIKEDNPVMIGTMAGITDNAKISNCRIYSRVELESGAKLNGAAGLVGYGCGSVDNSKINSTVVVVDTNKEERDENFLAGVYAAGYLDMDSLEVTIDGYDSDHGYVHSGGLVGMYILYPASTDYKGRVTNNTVNGKITFFEDNTDRRAYCKGLMGEVMNWTFEAGYNDITGFERNEVFEYDKNLYPEGNRDEAVRTEERIEPTSSNPGYTQVNYSNGYSYNTDYTLPVYTVENWEVVKEATDNETGIKKGTDINTGKTVYESYASEVKADESIDEAKNLDKTSTIKDTIIKNKDKVLVVVAVIVVIILLVLRFTVFKTKRNNK